MTIERLEYTVKRSKRKTLAIRFEYNGSVTVLAPITASNASIEKAVKNNAEWIAKKAEERRKFLSGKNTEPISVEEVLSLKMKAENTIPARLDRWAERLGVSYNKLTVKTMYSRWGSCSIDKNISINCLLILAPDIVIDYILVHELSHLKFMDHSKAFYAFVDSNFPYRKESQRWLKEDGALLIGRAKRGIITKNDRIV